MSWLNVNNIKPYKPTYKFIPLNKSERILYKNIHFYLQKKKQINNKKVLLKII